MLRNYFKISDTKNKRHENHIAKSVRFIASSSAGNGSSPGKQGTEDGTPTRTRLPRLETQQEKSDASPPFKRDKGAASTGGTSGSSGSAPAAEDADHVTAAELLRQKEAEAKKKLKRLKGNADAEAPGKKAAKGHGGAKAPGKKAANSEGDTEASGKSKGKGKRRKDATGVEL